MSLQSYLKKQSAKIEKALKGYLPRKEEHPSTLHEAMRYVVLSGGKRVRPILTLAACEAVGGEEKKAVPVACALELIHNYSLVHDDLPCMDDDDLRRGKPTCHKKFSEETAVLAGDALLTLAFKLLTSANSHHTMPGLKKQLEVASDIADAIGTRGMVGGQAVDIEFQNKELDLPTIEYINTHKSGALIAVSLKAGAMLGGGGPREVESLYRYGKCLGLLFQIVDDILDREGYAKVVGVSEARQEAERLHSKAKKELRPFGQKAKMLNQLTDFVLTREY